MSFISLGLGRRMSLRQRFSIRLLLLITSISFTMSMVWMQFVHDKILSEEMIQEAIQNVARDLRYTEVYRRRDKLPGDLKYMLFWSDAKFAPFNFFGEGQRKFIEKNCSNINCYVTDDRNFFNGDTTKFDAIAFNGRTILDMNESDFPKKRSPHQKFIYFNMESADNFPVCSEFFDNFFNWTVTYRLDSDVPFPYIQIRDTHGKVVGPKKDMQWLDMGNLADEELETLLQNKTKAAAWFVSHCATRSGRLDYAKQLKKALYPFGMSVDIYGKCGPLKCPRQKYNMCYSLLKRHYAFYLSFENSFADDYVTEKLLTALQHNAIPIVLGGGNYSRFLPPGSYLDASKVKPKVLASMMVRIMLNTTNYIQFFRWWSHYTYHDPIHSNICGVCEALNDKKRMERRTTYRRFREWWNPKYTYRC